MEFGTHEVEGKVFRFKKPHLGPLRAFEETTARVKEKTATATEAYAAGMALVLDAIHREMPEVTRADVEAVCDDESFTALFKAIHRFAMGAREETPGEAGSP